MFALMSHAYPRFLWYLAGNLHFKNVVCKAYVSQVKHLHSYISELFWLSILPIVGFTNVMGIYHGPSKIIVGNLLLLLLLIQRIYIDSLRYSDSA